MDTDTVYQTRPTSSLAAVGVPARHTSCAELLKAELAFKASHMLEEMLIFESLFLWKGKLRASSRVHNDATTEEVEDGKTFTRARIWRYGLLHY